MAESGLAYEGDVLGTVGHIEAAEEILILIGNCVAAAVVLEILEVSLNHRVHVTHLRHEEVLALHDPVENIIESGRGWRSRLRDLSGRGWRTRWRCCWIQGRLCRRRRRSLSDGREDIRQQNKNQCRARTNNSHRNLLGVDHAN